MEALFLRPFERGPVWVTVAVAGERSGTGRHDRDAPLKSAFVPPGERCSNLLGGPILHRIKKLRAIANGRQSVVGRFPTGLRSGFNVPPLEILQVWTERNRFWFSENRIGTSLPSRTSSECPTPPFLANQRSPSGTTPLTLVPQSRRTINWRGVPQIPAQSRRK